jgi:hypothetical protein
MQCSKRGIDIGYYASVTPCRTVGVDEKNAVADRSTLLA